MGETRARSTIGLVLAAGLLVSFSAPAGARDAVMKLRHAEAKRLSFADLNGWKDDDQAEAFQAFMVSCRAILNGTKAMRRARPVYGALYKVCERAQAAGTLDRKKARAFFEANFKPVRLSPPGESDGFYTGYYETEVEGSRVETAEYNVPIYRSPKPNSKSSIVTHFDRGQIEEGALAGKNLEICWVKNPVDVFFAQIQGSTRVKLPDGHLLRLNYIASNGLPYTPVGRFLVDSGAVAKDDMSMDRIRSWMEANPDEATALRRKNRSYVFFEETDLGPNDQCIGAQGVPLTPLRSVAVDKAIHTYGTPIWVDAELPIASEQPTTKFRRLMFAQDTGAAIVGAARADLFFGAGEGVGHIAGRIKQYGQFVMLVPRGVVVHGVTAPVSTDVPLPRPRPKEISTKTAAAAPAKSRP
jgi:membrane-bound lytic murein transglycosylase A